MIKIGVMDERLLKILACPQCKGDLKYDGKEKLICEKCDVFYPIVDGIPRMIPKKMASKKKSGKK